MTAASPAKALKEACKAWGLPVGGTKGDLWERLVNEVGVCGVVVVWLWWGGVEGGLDAALLCAVRVSTATLGREVPADQRRWAVAGQSPASVPTTRLSPALRPAGARQRGWGGRAGAQGLPGERRHAGGAGRLEPEAHLLQ